MNTEQLSPRSSSIGQAAVAASRIEIYFKTWCPYSQRALAVLNDIGVPYTSIDVTHDRVLEAEMIDRSGRTSVPQIFIDFEPIGGYDELEVLIASGAYGGLLGDAVETPLAA